uniref:hypothetical protein n=1 Tax=Klebsiella pneumoniae TaxID=573 RepID=UPI00117AD731
MNKQSITPEQFRAVAGTMPACRAADALGISQANFYRLAQSYSISTAFVYKPWKPEEKQIVAEMRAAGLIRLLSNWQAIYHNIPAMN